MEDILKNLNYQPTCLTKDELENPLEAMTSFFANHSIHQSRENLWQLYKGWIYHSSEYIDDEQSKDMVFFYSQLIELLNVSFVYTEKKKLEI